MRYFVILGVLALSTGCATYVRVDPAPGEAVSYFSGRAIATSESDASTVMVSPGRQVIQKGKRMGFYVTVRNDSDQTKEIGIHDVTANSPEASLQVYSYADLVAEIKRQQMWAAVGSALQGAADGINAANAGYSTTTTTGTYSGYGTYNSYGSGGSSYGSYNSYGSYSGVSTTYDPAKAAAARADANRASQERMAQIAENTASEMEIAERTLRRTTLKPGFSYDSLIVIDAPKQTPSRVDLQFNVGGDLHRLSFDYVSNQPAKQ